MNVGDGVALGVFLVGISGYLINAVIDRRARASVLRTEAYLDYVRCNMGMAVLANPNNEDFQRFFLQELDAPARVLIYGSKEVVRALRELRSCSARLDNPVSQRAFSDLISAMRKDATGNHATFDEVTRILVLARSE